jgi:hypothetical protein
MSHVMRKRVGIVAALSALVCVPAALGAPAWHTQREAELNLLRAPRLMARWHPSLADGRTKLVQRNVTASCRGRGVASRGRYASFTCDIRGARVVVRARYFAQPRGFAVRKLYVSRPR